jgi:exosortase/archaeosortase family protein
MSKLFKHLFLSYNRAKIFYLLAFAPLILIVYYQPGWPFAVISPAYGFIILTLKKDNLFSRNRADNIQRIIGVAIVLGSFFVYYPMVSSFPKASFYNVVNYAIFILGLFIAFFEIYALKEALSSLFLILAATLNSLLFAWLEPLLSPYINHFVSLMSFILKTLGMNVTTQYPDIIVLHAPSGSIPNVFTWGCVAGSSIVFSIILFVFLLEETAQPRTKLLWAIIGICGTLIVNIMRIAIIFLSYQSYGFEAGREIHWYLGYALFITWLALFFYMFAKRETIVRQIKSIPNRLSRIQ